MNCPTCGHGNNVVLRTKDVPEHVERTRECLACGKRWKTIEADSAKIQLANDIIEVGQRLRDIVPER